MAPWYTRNLGDAMLAGEPLEQLREVFLSEYKRAGRPDDMALYVRHESEGKLHCELKVFLTPASARAAERVNAAACPRPSPAGLDLLAGSQQSLSLLFPDE